MPRLFFATVTASCCGLLFAGQVRGATNVASRADHVILKEPSYQSAPKYCLISLDNSGVKVWMVEDGKRLFVDKNANGDLTDDGPPIEPSKVRKLDTNSGDFEYALDAITPTNGARHTKFVLYRWNYNDKQDSYGLSLSVDGKLPMYAGWFGTFWSTNRETAPVVHFGGAFKPQMLRREAFTLGEKGERLSVCFMNPGSGPGTESRISIEAMPSLMEPVLNIEWPVAPGGAPLRTTHELTERCCYWEFYTTDFEVPKGAVAGSAKISVDLTVGVFPFELKTNKMEMSVVGK